MRVGSLHSPWEYDGRLPPDVGYYLDLVLPRKKEPRKKTRACLNNLHGRILQIEWSTYKPTNPRILVNLLILAETLANLLVKTNQIRFMGAIGAWVRGIHSGEARTAWLIVLPEDHGPWANPPRVRLLMRLLMRLLLGLLELLGILPILPDLLGLY